MHHGWITAVKIITCLNKISGSFYYVFFGADLRYLFWDVLNNLLTTLLLVPSCMHILLCEVLRVLSQYKTSNNVQKSWPTPLFSLLGKWEVCAALYWSGIQHIRQKQHNSNNINQYLVWPPLLLSTGTYASLRQIFFSFLLVFRNIPHCYNSAPFHYFCIQVCFYCTHSIFGIIAALRDEVDS